MSTVTNPYLAETLPLAPAEATSLSALLKRFVARLRRKHLAFAIGQKVAWGIPPRSQQGKIIAVIPQPDADFPLLRIRYYDDPAQFGHPVPVEIELPAQLVRPVQR